MPHTFEALLPEKGFLREYVEWTRCTEPPTSFHFFTAVSILGATLERRVYVDQGLYKIYGAGTYILVAPTGICRKSTCTRLGMKVFKLARPDYVVVNEKATPEGLVSLLTGKIIVERKVVQRDATCMIHAPELGVFLGRQIYNEGLVVLLTSLIDQPDEFESRLAGGDRLLKNICLSLLGASNPDWLASAIPVDAHGGGFLSRVLHICENTTDRCFPRPPKLSVKKRDELVELLRAYSRLEGEFVLTNNADKWFHEWYRVEGRQLSTIEGMESRRPDHVLRLALNLAVAEDLHYEIHTHHLTHALKILAHVLGRSEIEVAQVALNDMKTFYITKHLSRKQKIQHSDLLRLCIVKGISTQDMIQRLEQMIEAGMVGVSKVERQRGVKGKGGTWYIWKGHKRVESISSQPE